MNKKSFLRQLEELVALRTVTADRESNSKALDLIESWTPGEAKIKRIKNGKAEILIVGNKDLMSPDVAYLVHIDVVPGTDDLFKMSRKGDKLFGRGVSDMKFSVPMGLSLLDEVIKKKLPLSFGMVVTTDEETGGFDGGEFLATKLGFRPKLLIVPDGGDNGVFVEKAKGVCMVRVDSKGVSTHSSRIWEGKNAIEPLVKLSNLLLERYGMNNKSETWKTTMNIGKFHGGEAGNQVCPEASAVFDFRFPESRSWREIEEEVREEAKKIDAGLRVSCSSVGDPTFTSANLLVVKKYLSAMEQALGAKVDVGRAYGASDARHFSFLEIPILMSKPEGGEIHADGEWISLDSCMKFYKGLSLFIAEMV